MAGNNTSLSDYRGNANPLASSVSSTTPVLFKPIGARRVIVGVASTLLILFPTIFRWILIKNNGGDSIWVTSGVPAVVGLGFEVAPATSYLVNPIPFNQMNAISENAENIRVYVSEF